MKFDETVFKSYDIRGKAPQQLTPELAEGVGRALGDFLEKPGAVAVGRDMRTESAELAEHVIAGLVQQGRDVIDVGLVTSDMIYFAVGNYNLAGGAMVTASHNPGQDDGIKMVADEAKPIGHETGLQEIRWMIRDDKLKGGATPGKVSSKDIVADWVKHALSFIDSTKLKPFKVAIDAGNGMAGAIIPKIEPELPIKITPLFFKVDGSFPNHPANPMIIDNLVDLRKAVKDLKLDFGIAFDGDGDRAFFVDETGQPLSGSILMAILSKYMLKLHPGSAVVYNALMSRIVHDTIKQANGRPFKVKVGNESAKIAMREHDAILGGEHAGHYYFRDNYYSDSGLIAALVAMAAVSDSGQTLSQLAEPYRNYFDSQEINRQVGDLETVVELLIKRYHDGDIDLLDGLSVYYPDWWFNVRASNTEPLLRLNVEADNPYLLQEKTYELLNMLRS